MQLWSVGLRDDITGLHHNGRTASLFRHFNNGLELIIALREHAAGRLAILLTLRLPILDGLGIIRLLQQEGMIDRHHFILAAPDLSAVEQQFLDQWQVETVRPSYLSEYVSQKLVACG